MARIRENYNRGRMRRIDTLFADYGASHSTRGNLRCHAAGITLIVFGLLCFLSRIPIGGIWTASELLVVLAFVFYATLDLPIALAMLAYAAILDFAARSAQSWPLGLAAFITGWVLQGIGHAVYEKNRPAFLRNLVHLLIGPAYLVAEALRLSPRASALSRRSS
jgi:uncharacterized membrane protein YGL010W